MNNYVSSIDTDIGIGSILSNFETAWVMNTVRESLDIRFRPYEGPMPNFVDILNFVKKNIDKVFLLIYNMVVKRKDKSG